MMIGTLLELLEPGGPEAVTEQLSQFPPGQHKELARTVLASGFPVPEALEEFRTLVAEPILHDPAAPHRPRHPDAAHPPEAATPPLIYALRRDHWGPRRESLAFPAAAGSHAPGTGHDQDHVHEVSLVSEIGIQDIEITSGGRDDNGEDAGRD
jgi:hypothetical protein